MDHKEYNDGHYAQTLPNDPGVGSGSRAFAFNDVRQYLFPRRKTHQRDPLAPRLPSCAHRQDQDLSRIPS